MAGDRPREAERGAEEIDRTGLAVILAGDADAAALLGGLNEVQREAVQCLDASLVIAAGPGTGKTRTAAAFITAI